jgi:hypothetical protein
VRGKEVAQKIPLLSVEIIALNLQHGIQGGR